METVTMAEPTDETVRPTANVVAITRGVLAGFTAASFAAISQLSTLAIPIDRYQWYGVLCFSMGSMLGVAGFAVSYAWSETGLWLYAPRVSETCYDIMMTCLLLSGLATFGGLACISVRLLGSPWWFALFGALLVVLGSAVQYFLKHVKPRFDALCARVHAAEEAAKLKKGQSVDE